MYLHIYYGYNIQVIFLDYTPTEAHICIPQKDELTYIPRIHCMHSIFLEQPPTQAYTYIPYKGVYTYIPRKNIYSLFSLNTHTHQIRHTHPSHKCINIT